jgi:hypothetical protein
MSEGGKSGSRGRGGKGGGRGGKTGRVKRQQVESEDGWTVITHGMSKLNVDSKKKSELKVAGQLPSTIVKDLTTEKMLSEFKVLQERWKDTPVAKQIQELLDKRSWAANEAVCIGIGSFSRDWAHRYRSLWQLVLFVDVVSHLHNSSKIQTYAQDPAFTSLDISFLASLDITTTTAGIEDHITSSSFVFSPFVDWFILLPMFLKGKDPEVYVGNEILEDYGAYAQSEDKKMKVEESNTIGKEFLGRREKVKLRDFEHHAHALNGMVIYTKPLSTPTEDDIPT